MEGRSTCHGLSRGLFPIRRIASNLWGMRKPTKPPVPAPATTEPNEAASMETAKRIMKRLAETPYEPHKSLGKRPSKAPYPPKAKERPASKGRVHKGKTRN
jgi:hypothetical protein